MKLLCRYRGLIPIDLFCSLIFMQSVTEMFPAQISPLYEDKTVSSGAHEYSTTSFGLSIPHTQQLKEIKRRDNWLVQSPDF